MGLQQQVLRRIARERELREHHELAARIARPGDPVAHLRGIALEVADRRVDLRERDSQELIRHGSKYGETRGLLSRDAVLAADQHAELGAAVGGLELEPARQALD